MNEVGAAVTAQCDLSIYRSWPRRRLAHQQYYVINWMKSAGW